MFFRKKDKTVKKELLGQILLKRNLITRDQLKQALRLQRKDRAYLGDILIKHGFIEEKDVMVALVIQCNFPYIAIDQYEIDSRLLALIPKETAQRLHLIPLERVGDVLSVVMANPLDGYAKEEIQKLTQCCLAPFIATRVEIDNAISRCYS